MKKIFTIAFLTVFSMSMFTGCSQLFGALVDAMAIEGNWTLDESKNNIDYIECCNFKRSAERTFVYEIRNKTTNDLIKISKGTWTLEQNDDDGFDLILNVTKSKTDDEDSYDEDIQKIVYKYEVTPDELVLKQNNKTLIYSKLK